MTTPPTANHPPHKLFVAGLEHLPFINALQRRYTNEIGYIGQEATRVRVEQQNVLISTENDEPAGMLLGKLIAPTMPGVTPIFQAAVCYDAQRRHHGEALVHALKRRSIAAGNTAIQLWCRTDLDANEFWRAQGGIACAARTGGKGRGLPHILWRIPLIPAAAIRTLPAGRRAGAAGWPVFAADDEAFAALNTCPAADLRKIADELISNAGRLISTAARPTSVNGRPSPTNATRPTVADATPQLTLF